jgi:tetratricopeptide (TPR) repeat protein
MRLFLLAFSLSLGAAGAAFADQTDPRLDRLFLELRTGEAVSANENVDRIVEIWSDSQSDTVDLLFARAAASADAGEVELSITLLDHVVGLAPNFAQGFALRGAMRLRIDDVAGAVGDFSTAIRLEPRHFGALIALAQVLEANGDKPQAYETYQDALEWNPHDEHALRRAKALRDELAGQEI